MAVRIQREPARQEVVMNLLALSDTYYAGLYPSESNHLLDVATLEDEAVTFLVARDSTGVLGFGALVARDGYGEIKRMFVVPEARGRHLGKDLLNALEEHARSASLASLRLETGIRQPEAIALYRMAGFAERGPFGNYTADPLSIFMEKTLTPHQ
jgi:putative acetyltransferase